MSGTQPRRQVRRLLVVDFDFFFANPAETGDDPYYLYDWQHAETRYGRYLAWPVRAAGFFARGLPLPRCAGYETFWQRFTHLSRTAPLWIADSNAYAGTLGRGVDDAGWQQVWLYDAHHDAGYGQSYDTFRRRHSFSAEDWTYALYQTGAAIHVRYPPWKRAAAEEGRDTPLIPVDLRVDPGGPVHRRFDGVFVCRSGAWVPAWCDDQWDEFLTACPISAERRHVMDHEGLRLPRWTAAHRREAEDAGRQWRRDLSDHGVPDEALNLRGEG
jgi:hypothetical protein